MTAPRRIKSQRSARSPSRRSKGTSSPRQPDQLGDGKVSGTAVITLSSQNWECESALDVGTFLVVLEIIGGTPAGVSQHQGNIKALVTTRLSSPSPGMLKRLLLRDDPHPRLGRRPFRRGRRHRGGGSCARRTQTRTRTTSTNPRSCSGSHRSRCGRARPCG
jgi:hypothetical protein